MSFERLRYDTCSYDQRLKETTSPGLYMLNTPYNECDAADLPADPYMRYQAYGPATCPPGAAVDDHSELLGITRRASECPTKQYLRKDPLPVGQCPKKRAAGASAGVVRPITEPTRLSNPPCTLRGTGINRWQWLPENPQDRAIPGFELNVNYRTVAKDNYRPCLFVPQDPSPLLPVPVADTTNHVAVRAPNAMAQGPGAGMLPSWRSCEAVKSM